MRRALHADVDGIEAVLAAMTQPEIAIVSLTVTEKGYCYLPSSSSIDKDHPLIQHDLQHPRQPRSAPGVIIEALRIRREKGLPAFSVMSCDNMPNNGRVARNVILALAKASDAGLAQWIEQHVTFPSTMVDRIVPAMTPASQEKITGVLGGMIDAAGIACEPFRQWVIEDNFVAGRPEWEKAGAELVADVLPYEEMKLRMLNGSHSFLAYLGYLAGYEYIDRCMEDAHYASAARALMINEQAPTLHTRHVDLNAYAESLLGRYRNTGLKHRTWQIAMDGTLKLPQRMLDSIRIHLTQGTGYPLLALGVAGWMRYVGGVDDQGHAIDISDPLKDKLAQLVKGSADGEERVKALLSGIEETDRHLRCLGFEPDRLTSAKGFARIAAIADGADAVINSRDEGRRRFEILARQVFIRFKALIMEPAAFAYAVRHDNIEAIYKKLEERRDTADVTDLLKELHRIVNEAIRTAEPGEDQMDSKMFDMSTIDLEKLRVEFEKKVKRKASALEDIQEVVRKKLERMLEQNPLRMDYYKKYSEIIADYNRDKDRVTIEETFTKLVDFVTELDAEDHRAVEEGLTEDEYAVFCLLQKENLAKTERERVKQASQGLLDALRKLISQRERWTEKEETKAEVEVLIRDEIYTLLPTPPFTDDEKAAMALRVYEHMWAQSASGGFAGGVEQ